MVESRVGLERLPASGHVASTARALKRRRRECAFVRIAVAVVATGIADLAESRHTLPARGLVTTRATHTSVFARQWV